MGIWLINISWLKLCSLYNEGLNLLFKHLTCLLCVSCSHCSFWSAGWCWALLFVRRPASLLSLHERPWRLGSALHGDIWLCLLIVHFLVSLQVDWVKFLILSFSIKFTVHCVDEVSFLRVVTRLLSETMTVHALILDMRDLALMKRDIGNIGNLFLHLGSFEYFHVSSINRKPFLFIRVFQRLQCILLQY